MAPDGVPVIGDISRVRWPLPALPSTQWLLSPSGLPYCGAFVGGTISSILTYYYVAAGAYELNPVMRVVIGAFGLQGMVILKTGVIIGAYWGYRWLRRDGLGPVVTVVAWVGAVYHLAGAVHDVRVAVSAPLVPAVSAGESLLFAGVVVAGLLLWPR